MIIVEQMLKNKFCLYFQCWVNIVGQYFLVSSTDVFEFNKKSKLINFVSSFSQHKGWSEGVYNRIGFDFYAWILRCFHNAKLYRDHFPWKWFEIFAPIIGNYSRCNSIDGHLRRYIFGGSLGSQDPFNFIRDWNIIVFGLPWILFLLKFDPRRCQSVLMGQYCQFLGNDVPCSHWINPDYVCCDSRSDAREGKLFKENLTQLISTELMQNWISPKK